MEKSKIPLTNPLVVASIFLFASVATLCFTFLAVVAMTDFIKAEVIGESLERLIQASSGILSTFIPLVCMTLFYFGARNLLELRHKQKLIEIEKEREVERLSIEHLNVAKNLIENSSATPLALHPIPPGSSPRLAPHNPPPSL